MPKSFTIAPIFRFGLDFKMWFKSVVLPEPKKPEIIITGIFRFFCFFALISVFEKSSKISFEKFEMSKSSLFIKPV